MLDCCGSDCVGCGGVVDCVMFVYSGGIVWMLLLISFIVIISVFLCLLWVG